MKFVGKCGVGFAKITTDNITLPQQNGKSIDGQSDCQADTQ